MTDIRFKAEKKAEFEDLHVEWEIARTKGIVWKTSPGPTKTAWIDDAFVEFLERRGFQYEIV